MAGELSRPEYSARYGPTTGDRVRLGDTDLLARIERDETSYGDEVLRGWAKTLRTGIMTSAELPAASELDLIVTNVIVIDPVLGVLKANIGVKDGVIVGVGRAGNPDVVDNPDLLIGSNTAPVYGQGYIATPGGIDTHVHLVTPRLIPVAAGRRDDDADHRRAQREPGLQPRADVPRVRGLSGEPGHPRARGQLHGGAARAGDRVRRVRPQGPRGLRGVPEHRRRGAHRGRRATTSRSRCTPTASTSRASSTRRSPRSPGAASTPTTSRASAAATRPDILAIAGIGHVIGSSTTPTIPYGRNVVAEHHAMMWSVHGMNPAGAERSRDDRRPHPRLDDARRERSPRAGRDQHHQLRLPGDGADRRGHPADLAARPPDEAHARGAAAARQPAHPPVPRQVHDQPGAGPRRRPVGGLARAREDRRHRAVAPRVLRGEAGARDQGRLPGVGRARRGQRVDLGNRAADLHGALGRRAAWPRPASASTSSRRPPRPAASAGGSGTRRRALPVVGTRRVAKRHMLYNQANPRIEIDPGSAEIRIDGRPLPPIPDDDLPINRRYFLL